MKSIVKYIGIAVVLGLITGAIIGYFMWNKKHKDHASSKPDFIISATELMSQYEENEDVANEKYLGKILEVTGKVVDVVIDTTTTVVLDTESVMSGIACEMAPGLKAANLEQGMEVTLRGTCSGKLMDVVLSRCVLVNKSASYHRKHK